ncbi:hypothetical protein, partial [Massilia sp. LjRoot122]|uniref:hypothetical protein n=1 Tax=Massilia sp. LjRoot122 TaxID=3342257 RepID=UPI003F50CCC3
LERCARAVFYAVHLSAFHLVVSLAILSISIASLCGLFDGPDVARAAQSGITPEMLEAHYYMMRVIGGVGVFTACTKLYEVACKVRRHPNF